MPIPSPLVLTLPSNMLLGRGKGCPFEVALREGWLSESADTLVQRPIWIIETVSDRNRLWGCITLDAVAQITEPEASQDCIGTVDLASSFRVGNASELMSDDVPAIGTISPCSPELHEEACREALRSSPIMFHAPLTVVREFARSPSQLRRRARHLASTVSYSHTLSELTRWNKAPDLSGIGAAVLAQLEGEFKSSTQSELIAVSADADPLLRLMAGGEARVTSAPLLDQPTVDLVLVDVDPENIRARRFIVSKTMGVEDWMRKTEASEFMHQAMVRYVVEGLKTFGISAKQSRSIDLFVDISGREHLFEIKSANRSNFLDQLSFGVVQLHRYDLAYKDEFGVAAEKVLIMERPDGLRDLEDLSRLSDSLSVRLMFCDIRREWPQGLEGVQSLF
jgi:hypothetical protein